MNNTHAEATQPTAAQEAAWNKTKPTAEGAYYVRGFNLFQLAQYEALVQVRTHHFDGEPAPELVCNIHESTSNAEMDDWSPMVDMSGDFEWLGPLVIAPVAAAPVEITGVQLGLAMTAFDAAGGHQLSYAPLWMRKALEAASTPAAPGIDLHAQAVALRGLAAVIRQYGTCAPSALEVIADRIDASPKGGDVQDDRFPRGLIDAIEYADNMEEAAEGLYQHVFEHESDGEDCGTVILQRVLGYLKDSPKGGSDGQDAARYRHHRAKGITFAGRNSHCCYRVTKTGADADAATDDEMQATSAEVGA